MGPKPANERADHDLFRTELLNLINQLHELVRLAALIDWQAFEAEWSPQFVTTTGRPALPTRLICAVVALGRGRCDVYVGISSVINAKARVKLVVKGRLFTDRRRWPNHVSVISAITAT